VLGMGASLGIDTISASFRETICAVVVTYHPDLGLFDRIEKVVKQVGQTVIVDNGSPESCLEQVREIADKFATHLHLILNASNEGVASALNTGTRWAASRGYRWVLTLDQDTTVAPDMIASLEEVSRGYPLREALAVIGSNYRDKKNGKVLCDDAMGPDSPPGREVIAVLTSGSLVSVSAFKAIGGFRDDFFIDCVDHEYCLNARAHGFHVVMTSKPVMEHGIGHTTEHRLLWKTVATSNHSPARQYFMTRNTLIMAQEYIGKEPGWVLRYLWSWLKSILRVCLFEQERIAKIKQIVRGCVDGVLKRTNLNRRFSTQL
jgi:rhamnosyltransferase